MYRGEEDDSECTAKAQQAFDQMKDEEYYKRSKFSASNSEESSDENVDNKKNQRSGSHKERSHKQQDNFSSLESFNEGSSEYGRQNMKKTSKNNRLKFD